MKFIEKVKEKFPNCMVEMVIINNCPYHMGLEKDNGCHLDMADCTECWNRKMSEVKQ